MKQIKLSIIIIGLISGTLYSQTKPNVVFFLVDDLGYMDIGAYGSEFYETPNIDGLANSGMKFTQGYAASHVCSPTRASIMTGKYPARTHTTNFFSGARTGQLPFTPYDDFMALSEVTIAEAMKENGYSTCFLGKWHLGEDSEFWPENQGFDTNFGGWAAGSPSSQKCPDGTCIRPTGFFSPYTNPRLPNGPDGEYLTDRLAVEAANWIDQHQAEPFFLYLAFYQVHNPMQPRQDLLTKYQNKLNDTTFTGSDFEPVLYNYTARQHQAKPNYAAMVEAHDLAVGVVLDKLKELNLDSNTIVFYTSDNGGLSTSEGKNTSNLPFNGGKGWLFEGGIREPWLVSWPGKIQATSISDELVVSTDFYPTILELADLPLKPQQHMDGVSFKDVVLNNQTLQREELYFHYPHYSNQGGRPSSAIRMGDYKLIEYFETNTVALYNLVDDIGEKNNLANDPSLADIRDLLLNKLHTWRADVDASRPPGHVQQATPALPNIPGCMDPQALNYYLYATSDDGSCQLPVYTTPNPLSFTLKNNLKKNTVQFSAAKGVWNIHLLDIKGKVLKSFFNINNSLTIDNNDLNSGIYLLKVNQENRKVFVL